MQKGDDFYQDAMLAEAVNTCAVCGRTEHVDICAECGDAVCDDHMYRQAETQVCMGCLSEMIYCESAKPLDGEHTDEWYLCNDCGEPIRPDKHVVCSCGSLVCPTCWLEKHQDCQEDE